jgi:hypothetical protein
MFKKVTLGGYTLAYNMSNQSVYGASKQINSLIYLILSSNPYIINLWYCIIFEAGVLFGEKIFSSLLFFFLLCFCMYNSPGKNKAASCGFPIQ